MISLAAVEFDHFFQTVVNTPMPQVLRSIWGKSNILLDEELDDVPLKLHIRNRNASSDTAKTMTDSVQYVHYQHEVHSINVKSNNYPQFLKNASEAPLEVPPRSQWVPLHPKSRFLNWKKSSQKLQEKDQSLPAQKIKTGWGLPGMELKRSVTSGFSFKKRGTRVAPLQEPDLDSENGSTLTALSAGFPERLDSNLGHIKYSNYYTPGEGDSWIFVHRDQNGRLIGQYEIKGSCI
jgi:hypothetical protein